MTLPAEIVGVIMKDSSMTNHFPQDTYSGNTFSKDSFLMSLPKPTKMKAATYSKYGPPIVVGIQEVPVPEIKDHEVLIRIRAASVSSGDWRARSLSLPKGFGLLGRLIFGITGPRKPILGTELSGEVIDTGKDVTEFVVGDQVIAFADTELGCHAEYRAFDQNGLITKKPANLSFEHTAALSFGGTTALSFLRDKAKVQQGEKVLIIGASGSVGSAAVQIGKYLGAEVTGVCSTRNLDIVCELGADHVIDYTQEDVTKLGEKYDVILNCNAEINIRQYETILNANGRLVLVLGSFAQAIGLDRMSRKARKAGKRIIGGVATAKRRDIELLAHLAANLQFTPVIEHVYPFSEIMCAHAAVESGHKRGNVIVKM